MNSRRQFLVKGSLAGTALLAAKPMQSLAQLSDSVLRLQPGESRLFFLCTPGALGSRAIPQPFSANTAPVYIHAGELDAEKNYTHYSASFNTPGTHDSAVDEYKIIYRQGVKIGILTATRQEPGLIGRLNETAALLKKSKKCQLVVCLSGLGLQKEEGTDDCSLAENSRHIDIILGTHPQLYSRFTRVIRNLDKEEVILQQANGRDTERNGFEVVLDRQGKKKMIRVQRFPHPKEDMTFC